MSSKSKRVGERSHGRVTGKSSAGRTRGFGLGGECQECRPGAHWNGAVWGQSCLRHPGRKKVTGQDRACLLALGSHTKGGVLPWLKTESNATFSPPPLGGDGWCIRWEKEPSLRWVVGSVGV